MALHNLEPTAFGKYATTYLKPARHLVFTAVKGKLGEVALFPLEIHDALITRPHHDISNFCMAFRISY